MRQKHCLMDLCVAEVFACQSAPAGEGRGLPEPLLRFMTAWTVTTAIQTANAR